MPIFNNATVTSSEQVWASPDGQRKLFNVTMTLETGQSFQAKSWSERLVPGFKGDLETYEKEGKQGIETFVRQAPKEGGSFGGPNRQGGGGKPQADPFTMYLSYAKDILVAMIETGGFDQGQYDQLLQAAIHGGHTLHDGRPGAEVSSGTVQTALPTTPDIIQKVPDEPINLDDIPF